MTQTELSELIVNEKGQLREDFMNNVYGCDIIGLKTWNDNIDRYKLIKTKINKIDYVYSKDTFN